MKKFLILLFAVMLLFTGCSEDKKSVEVSVAKVLTNNENVTVNHEGKISFAEEIKITSPISGKVVATYFEAGKKVTEGQPLFKIGERKDDEELLRAKENLGESMALLAREQSELAKLSAAQKPDENPTPELTEKKITVENLRAELDEQKELIKELEEIASSGTVNAPAAGTLSGEKISLGTQVTANETVLTTLGDINHVSISFETSDEEKHLLVSSPEIKVKLKSVDGSIYNHEGKINFVHPTMLEAVFDNPDEQLIVGDNAEIIIEGIKIPEGVLVPIEAVGERDGKNFIFTVGKDNEAILKEITLGGKLGSYYIINEGLKADDSVVVEGMTNLREGTPLKCNYEL
ncbi:MAG: efflux RND transporter periplasmic adaptor subunit [Selenomonadaceae bacterium]|nr:efflux RND transporter periplasmic adaptor subunit [Selenomonadaceae bacterium]